MKKIIFCSVLILLGAGCLEPTNVPTETSVKLNPSALADMIAAGDFELISPNINDRNFPDIGAPASISDMVLLDEKDLQGPYGLEDGINRKGFRPATLADLLVYAKARWNATDLVVALGSSWVGPGGPGDIRYPNLSNVFGRVLELRHGCPGERSDEDCKLLVVRK